MLSDNHVRSPKMFRNCVWEEIPARFQQARSQFAAVSVGASKLAVLGADYDTSVEVLDLRNNTWSSGLPPMLTPRLGCCAVSLRNRIYVFGGYVKRGVLGTVDRLDLQTHEWVPVAGMPTRLIFCAAVAVDAQRILVVGGKSGLDDSSVNQAYLFDVHDNKWSRMPDMHRKRSGCATVMVHSRVYVVGGYNHVYEDSMEMFDFSTRIWTMLPPMREKRRGCAAVAVGDCIVVMGGCNGRLFLQNAEVFHVATQTWTGLPKTMSAQRYQCAAALVGNDIVLAGGIGRRAQKTAEKMTMDPYYMTVSHLGSLMRQDDLPLGLWSHILSNSSPSIVYFIMCSGKLAIDSVLLQPN